jgi:hypothetical protein
MVVFPVQFGQHLTCTLSLSLGRGDFLLEDVGYENKIYETRDEPSRVS